MVRTNWLDLTPVPQVIHNILDGFTACDYISSKFSVHSKVLLFPLYLTFRSFVSSVTLNPVARRMCPAMGKKRRRRILLHFPQALHTPAPELTTALLSLTAQLPVASHWRVLTFSQRLLLSGVWKKSAGLSLHFKVGVE